MAARLSWAGRLSLLHERLSYRKMDEQRARLAAEQHELNYRDRMYDLRREWTGHSLAVAVHEAQRALQQAQRDAALQVQDAMRALQDAQRDLRDHAASRNITTWLQDQERRR